MTLPGMRDVESREKEGWRGARERKGGGWRSDPEIGEEDTPDRSRALFRLVGTGLPRAFS